MRISRRVLVGLGVVGVAGGLYLLDLALAAGEVPRGTVIAGVDVGGRSRAAAQAAVQAEIDRKSGQDLPIRIGDVDVFIKPRDAGLSVDWPATWARVGGQPLNPIARVRIRV
ncbi:MAG: vancomycin resistance protein, partial [Streptomycetaceae bacterium]|nr:vancomycin resistance protein [Streptomycetaceae bacterium]